MSSIDALELGATPTSAPSNKGIIDLPREVQKEIFSHCSQSDLICLSLVSREFRELAAAQLYRNFHIVFPDEDDPTYDSPIDGLAGGLDTFVTSDYDYAKHLRDLSLDTLSAGDRGETAYKPYLYSVSCGKFMNTLLHLTLKKAKSLEAFRWNIRVELSRPVYKALHQIDTLKVLHLRLQAGPSLYEAPPPLPFTGLSSAASSVIHIPDPAPPPLPQPSSAFPPPTFSIPNGAQVFYVAPSSAPPPPPIPPPKTYARHKPAKKSSLSKEPPTLSGFKNLRSLSVLDIDSLDVVTELKSCVRNSASTLTKLQLSFSDYLGSQARKPPPEHDPEDSDPDDEFQVVPVPPMSGFHDDGSGPARAFRAQEERKSQEAVLGRIFDVEPYLVKKPTRKPREKERETATGEPSSNPGKEFINSLTGLSRKLMKEVNGSNDLPFVHQDILDLIETAARKYVSSEEVVAQGRKKQDKKSGEGSWGSTALAETDVKTQDAEEGSDSGLFGTKVLKPKGSQKDASPDDIDIEEPLEQLSLECPETASTKTPPSEATTSVATPTAESSSSRAPSLQPRPTTDVDKAVSNLEAQKINFRTLAGKLANFEMQANNLNKETLNLRHDDRVLERLEEAENKMKSFSRNMEEIQKEMSIVEAEIDDAEKQLPLALGAKGAEAQQRHMTEYLRSTRGIPLETLSLYLVPVKASVLSKAIDIRALRRITLLNVGPQAPIWAHFHKENKESPLGLRKIFTDNVSMPFLNFVSALDEVHDLFMLERDHKYKPESFAPKTNTTIAQIRRLVLKKHMHTLKRLMIKNLLDTSWDIDEKTFSLVCGHGQQLQELACSTTIKALHVFMRKMPKLGSLRALHIVSLRNDDTCVWVMRETKEFLLDNLSHHPEMKLEWLSIDEEDKVDRIILSGDLPTKTKKKRAKKDKGKQKATTAPTAGDYWFPVFPPLSSWDGDSGSDEEDEEEIRSTVERMPGVRFYDVWDVRIFKKEVVNGRL